jgi:hypothetical protein
MRIAVQTEEIKYRLGGRKEVADAAVLFKT